MALGISVRRDVPRRGAPGKMARHEERVAYLFLVPWFVGLLAFLLIPLVWSVNMSFTDTQLLRPGATLVWVTTPTCSVRTSISTMPCG